MCVVYLKVSIHIPLVRSLYVYILTLGDIVEEGGWGIHGIWTHQLQHSAFSHLSLKPASSINDCIVSLHKYELLPFISLTHLSESFCVQQCYILKLTCPLMQHTAEELMNLDGLGPELHTRQSYHPKQINQFFFSLVIAYSSKFSSH